MTQKGFALIKSAMLFDVQKTLQIGWSVFFGSEILTEKSGGSLSNCGHNIIGDTYIPKIVLTKLYYTVYSIINQTILISHII